MAVLNDMENFVIDVAPPKPLTDVSATLDDLLKHAELYYQGADIVWMLISSALVFQMVPAMCLFYSGATSRLSSLKLFRLPLLTAAVVGFQWYLWGYTLAFTPAVTPDSLPGSSWYGWDSRGVALHDSIVRPVGSVGPRLPEIVFEFYESMFASFTAALVCGGAMRDDPENKFPSSDIPAGRFLIFISLWSLLVYNPVARWTWHWAGWSNQLGVMDFAGGTAVHITSGTTVLAFYIFYALQTDRIRIFKPRPEAAPSNDSHHPPPASHQAPMINASKPQAENGDTNSLTAVENGDNNSLIGSENSNHEDAPADNPPTNNTPDLETGTRSSPPADRAPHNVNNIVLGTALLWIGWFGFNGGSALGGNLRAASACVSTHVAACAGGTSMLLLFWASNYVDRLLKKKMKGTVDARNPSVTHFCDGVVIALVAITPGAGFVPVWSSGIFGIVSTIVVFFFKWFTARWLYDEPLYVFAIHAGGGMVGMILTGAFADPDVVGLDGYSTIPDRSRARRVGYQLADALAGFAYTFCMTLLILYGLKAVRSLLRGRWSSGFEKPLKSGRMRLEAVPLHEWVGGVTSRRQENTVTDTDTAAPVQHVPTTSPTVVP
ncbi:Rh-like protein/ammonium transporter [Coniochaeta ligniaria NRRL 30616]|uniref:Rh-like protein/ammonium transporter n=1 Tax=Coniochaeta ligniaria NRRL 30616 TaxID=1408157 RepID=A0A1J7J486_9PEZI|nr:Rh-like protein/ammonium transporter [Coniochaeta ligniaria NRRL 30616]